MKLTKTLLAGALLAGFGAAAHAETSVTLYGLIDTGIVYQRGKVGTDDANRGLYEGDYKSRVGMGDGMRNGSRWGLRGTEDLGNGVAANFVLESGFSSRDGDQSQGGRLFGRQATIGLSHVDAGSIDLGRQTNIASRYFESIDPFSLDFMTANMGTAFSAANTVRYDNSVVYQTPNWGGFQGGVGYAFSFDDVGGPTGFEEDENNRAVTAGLRYSGGPLEVALTYDRQFLAPSQPQPEQWIIGAAYDLEVVKLALAYGRSKDGVISGQDYDLMGGRLNTNTTAHGVGDTNGRFSWDGLRINSYMLGLTVPLGASKVYASWQRADPNKGMENLDVYSLGYSYDLSKRTNLYAFGAYTDGAAFVEGDKMLTVGVGLQHRF